MRVLAAAPIPALACTVLFTFSRGAIGATVVGVLAYVVLARPRGLLTGILAVGAAHGIRPGDAPMTPICSRPRARPRRLPWPRGMTWPWPWPYASGWRGSAGADAAGRPVARDAAPAEDPAAWPGGRRGGCRRGGARDRAGGERARPHQPPVRPLRATATPSVATRRLPHPAHRSWQQRPRRPVEGRDRLLQGAQDRRDRRSHLQPRVDAAPAQRELRHGHPLAVCGGARRAGRRRLPAADDGARDHPRRDCVTNEGPLSRASMPRSWPPVSCGRFTRASTGTGRCPP